MSFEAAAKQFVEIIPQLLFFMKSVKFSMIFFGISQIFSDFDRRDAKIAIFQGNEKQYLQQFKVAENLLHIL